MNKTIQDYKKDAILNKVIRYEEGIMSRRQWLKMMQVKRAFVEESQKNRIMFDRHKFNSICNHKEQEIYEAKCNELIPCYKIKLPGQTAYWEITKTEYEHFKALQLSEDINTEKMELTYKIEAGTATDQEIKEDEEREFEFFNKYCR